MNWLAQIEDAEVLAYLKSIKEDIGESKDWYTELAHAHREGIERGLNDIQEGRTYPHFDVVKKYGLES